MLPLNSVNQLTRDFISVHRGPGPIVAVAIHDGHAVRDEVADRFWISDEDRRREEDVCTGQWTRIAPTRVVGLRSRFEVDVNRPREKAVYLTPADAWGLQVWKEAPEDEILFRSLKLYDAFYDYMYQLLRNIEQKYGSFFVYDFHSYNHHRDGLLSPYSSNQDNPQINLCTGGMDLDRCEPLVACVEETLRAFDFRSGSLDVRRNIRFQSTRFSRWVHENFPGSGTSLAIEVKKFYMNEWTGVVDQDLVSELGQAFQSTVEPVSDALLKLNRNDRLLA
jgi:hypothetical protein